LNKKRKDIIEARKKLLSGIGVPELEEFSADPFQLEAIDLILKEVDTLVVAPTGTGKTFIAVEGIRKAIESGKRAIYTAPLKALSNTKYVEFKALFEPKYSVGLLTGDRKIEPDADVLVATTEIYRNDLYNYGDNYSLVVLDELHYLADPQRGPVWEESIILSPASATLLMLSASISNTKEIAHWISEVRGKEVRVVTEENRKVPLRYGFLHDEFGVVPLSNAKGEIFKVVDEFYQQTRSRRGGPYKKRGRGSSGPKRSGSGNKNSSNRSRRPKKK
jgi:superfamily II RNA helicase